MWEASLLFLLPFPVVFLAGESTEIRFDLGWSAWLGIVLSRTKYFFFDRNRGEGSYQGSVLVVYLFSLPVCVVDRGIDSRDFLYVELRQGATVGVVSFSFRNTHKQNTSFSGCVCGNCKGFLLDLEGFTCALEFRAELRDRL